MINQNTSPPDTVSRYAINFTASTPSQSNIGVCPSSVTTGPCELVCNGSFENMVSATPPTGPFGLSGIANAYNWGNANLGTSDLFWPTNPTFVNGVPCNWLGFQTAHTGTSYAGIITASNYDYGEYLQTKLVTTMQAGQSYEISMYVSRSDFQNPNNANLGIYLTNTLVSHPGVEHLTITPVAVFSNTALLNNPNDWQKITFCYTANGTENYLTIGQTTSLIPSFTIAPTSIGSCTAPNSPLVSVHNSYLYIDDVSVVPLSNTVSIATSSCSPVSFSLVGGCLPSATYTWNFGDSSPPSYAANPAHTYTTQGTFTVNVTASLTCGVYTATTTVTTPTCHNCSSSPSTSYSPFSATVILTSTSLNTPLAIINDITVPNGVTLTFANSEFLFAPNVKITVKNGGNLQIRGSHLYACGTEMWQGIVVESGGKISTIVGTPNTNLIEDAITAIDASGHTTSTLTGFGAILDINQAIFNKNLVAVKIATYQTSASIYPFKIANSVFTCRSLTFTPTSWPSSQTNGMRAASNPTNGLEAPYLLQNFPFTYLKSPYNYIPSETGIYVFAVGTTTGSTYRNIQIGSTASTADYNIFDGLQECIAAYNSNVLSLNNVFQNSQRDYYFIPPYGPSYWAGGTAIVHSVDNTFNANLNITANSTNPAFGNRFYNCHRGIYMYNTYNFVAQYATFRSTQSNTNTAFGPGNSGVLAQTNRFNYVISNNNVANVANPIAVNIWAGSYNFGTPLYGTYAAQLQIQNNYIGSQTTTATGITTQYVNQAIHLLSVVGNSFQAINNCAVNTNTINRVYRGIEINNVSKTNYPVNTGTNVITLLNDNIFNATQNAIRYTNNASGTVRGNTVSAVNTTNTLVTLFYAGGCTNNPTVACNNLSNSWQAFEYNGPNSNVFWRGNKMQTHARGLVLNNKGIIGTQGSSGNPSDNEWNNSWASSFGTYIGTSSAAQNSPIWYRSSGGIYAPPTPSGVVFPVFWYGAANTLSTTTGSFNCGGSPPPPPSSNMVLSNSSLSINSTNLSEEENYILQYANYSHVKNDVSLSSLNQSYISSNINSSIDKMYQLNELYYSGSLTSANSLNSTISATNTVEQNYKTFYSLYNKFSTGNFTSIDQSSLDQLSLLCPGTGGAVIYQARALRSYIHKTNYLYNEDCEVSKYSARENFFNNISEKANWSIDLFPNPNQGSFSILSNRPSEELNVIVMDINGKTFVNEKITTENFVYLFQLNLKNGVYIVTIENYDSHRSIKKIIVAK